ncbi:hypothetical protein TNCV_4600101 [Trichonephila clavipes]|nr:hypothetical protein TNCV_4600101 [Trichonephila clavipes]
MIITPGLDQKFNLMDSEMCSSCNRLNDLKRIILRYDTSTHPRNHLKVFLKIDPSLFESGNTRKLKKRKMDDINKSYGTALSHLSQNIQINEELFTEITESLFHDGMTMIKVGFLLSFSEHLINRNPEKKTFILEQMFNVLSKHLTF